MPGSYWNEEIETLSRDGIERLESERLQDRIPGTVYLIG